MVKRRKTVYKPPRSIRRMFPQVTQIVDADEPVIVHVKPSDCSAAEPLNPSECAMARAAKREFKVSAAVIGMASSYLISGTKAIRFSTPDSVRREIVSFDRHADFQPGEYYLTPKAPSNRFETARETAREKYHQRRNHGTNHNATRMRHKTSKVRRFGRD